MKILQLNPQTHEIELSGRVEDGIGHMTFTLSDKHGDICLTSEEAARIGKWFERLAKEIREKS